jgi:hypothetical protein
MVDRETTPDNWRYGIWDAENEEWVVRDQCESRTDELMESFYAEARFKKRKYG